MSIAPSHSIVGVILLLLCCTEQGCHAPTDPAALAEPALQTTGFAATVEATVAPPMGWQAEPLKFSDRHNHQVWLSPSGNTAYGVIRMNLPLPVGAETVLRRGFLPQMQKSEGQARLLSSERDGNLPGLRFVAEGGKYLLRANLITRGWKAWAVYAGTLRDHEIVPEELAQAEAAREETSVGEKH